ncbi:hypothetical protein B0T26DRAFT_733325 [Lasiosphaeria miniovina]|uniref:Zn(2)-C6 fungal-type domain-containing protein n=1 Tax=Lasiosphaeria miniovina TaxID=1954250 RepID=A0AA40DHN7_9PEZI|nr:uncharacterized protein B0T26DRAFT_733325 [Lasiosphaeria miniovina]KAK0703939.1 hypothetical protein B0T26DRAFT_733325 [Lasiosphaeria miniovina]
MARSQDAAMDSAVQPREPRAGRHPGLGRRKACDLCHLKKIKCDAERPTCSHCSIYKRECMWTPGLQRKPRSTVSPAIRNNEELEYRLALLETKLADASRQPQPQPPNNINSNNNNNNDPITASTQAWAAQADMCGDNSFFPRMPETTDIDLHSMDLPQTDIELGATLDLPPLVDVLPLVDDYFANFNHIVPLFLRAKFMDMLHEHYSQPLLRNETSWAVINVVLALSIRHRDPNLPSLTVDRTDEIHFFNRCLGNAQSAMNTLVMWDQDLKGIQVVLGLVILFLGTAHPHPSSVLIATAVKLVHKLRLHTKVGKEYMSPDDLLESNRVFWVTYVLDKDVTMRAREPYLLQDYDFDCDLPSLAADRVGAIPTLGQIDSDGGVGSSNSSVNSNSGNIAPSGATTWFNLFRGRIQLAQIQGQVYDWVYSVRAERMTADERQAYRDRLSGALLAWKHAIPDDLQPERLFPAARGDHATLRHLTTMHFAYYHCMFMTHQVDSHDRNWVKKLTDYSRMYAADAPDGFNQGILGSDNDGPGGGGEKLVSPLPASWALVVDSARRCMELFRLLDQADTAVMWGVICTYLSTLVVLLAHKVTVLERGPDAFVASDDLFIEEGIAFIKRMLTQTDDFRLKRLDQACTSLQSWGMVAAQAVTSALAARPGK